jgi:hypothetical protein
VYTENANSALMAMVALVKEVFFIQLKLTYPIGG